MLHSPFLIVQPTSMITPAPSSGQPRCSNVRTLAGGLAGLPQTPQSLEAGPLRMWTTCVRKSSRSLSIACALRKAQNRSGSAGIGDRRPSIGLLNKLFWVVVCRFWSGWKQALIVVTPETVVRWHRTGFRMYWRLIFRGRTQVGRRRTPKEVRELIFQMVAQNPTWGAPRIHGDRF